MTKDEEQKLYQSWELKWRAMDPWQQHDHVRRVRSERNWWVGFCSVLGLWQVGFGAWIWGNVDPWLGIAFCLGLVVLLIVYPMIWDLQRFLSWTKGKNG